MKNKFIAKAYIKMSNRDKRILKENLSVVNGLNVSDLIDDFVVLSDGCVSTIHPEGLEQWLFCYDKEYVCCNDFADTEESAIELFLELAQMEEGAGADARWLICETPHFDDMYNKTFERGEVIDSYKYQQVDMGIFYVATPLELAENWRMIKENNL